MAAPSDEAGLSAQEAQQHDPTLEWPAAGAAVPAAWASLVPRRPGGAGHQPFFLNHVRGHVRCRQAALRLGAAAGTLLRAAAMAFLLDAPGTPVASAAGAASALRDALLLGGESVGADLSNGLLTGSACVVAIFKFSTVQGDPEYYV